ncbi:MAG: hypothetical protein DHS20C15_00910 [Planctomycetota bacterium]|nr:MAG: hypothetical protein DHS20C15_00910 [Planctomycetota bacterium]
MILATLFTAFSLLAPVQDASPAMGLSAEPAQIEFGDAFQGEVLHQPVTVTNHGSTAFPVQRILTSCGCTVPTLKGADGEQIAVSGHADTTAIYTLEPGASMIIDVEFKTAGKFGLVQQKVSVVHQDANVPPLLIPLSVRVSTPISANPPWLNFGSITKGSTTSKIVKLNALAIGDWNVTGFEPRVAGRSLPEWLKLKMLDDEGGERRLEVSIDKPTAVGPFNEQVSIQLDHERVTSVDLSLTGIVESSVTFVAGNTEGSRVPASALVFDQVTPTSTATRTIHIENHDPATPYVLTDVEVVVGKDKLDYFVTELREIEAGVSYEVDLTVKGDIGGGVDDNGNVKAPFFRGSLRLLAEDHPDVQRKLMQFHGWVKTDERG